MTSWKQTTLVGVFAMIGVVACGGDAGDDAMDDMDMDTPTVDAPATDAPAATDVELPEGVTQEMVARGQQVFTGAAGGGTCFTCHTAEGTGTPLAPDLTDDTWINTSGRNFEEIVQLVTTGVPEPVEAAAAMPPMGGANLSEDDVRAVAAYVLTLGSG
ncbi:MAG: cytochrome c [Gemmatimonadota bacterium]